MPMWLYQLWYKVVDLDATVAYDEAGQELYGDSPIMPIPSSRCQGAEEGSPLHPDGSNVMEKGDQEVSPLGPDDSSSPVQPHEEGSPLEPDSFMVKGDEWGLEKLFEEPVHVYAKIKQSPSQTDGTMSGVSTGDDQSVMPAIHVEADLDEILPQDSADTGAETSSGKIVVTGMNSI